MEPPTCAECGTKMVFHHSDKENCNGTATLTLCYECPLCRAEPRVIEKGMI